MSAPILSTSSCGQSGGTGGNALFPPSPPASPRGKASTGAPAAPTVPFGNWTRRVELARDYVNFLHPVCKLTEKVRRGSRITRRYDAAQTPYRRLLASGVLSRKTERQLTARSAALNPLRLKLELESAQRTLAERAVHPVIVHPLRAESLWVATTALVGSTREASRRGNATGPVWSTHRMRSRTIRCAFAAARCAASGACRSGSSRAHALSVSRSRSRRRVPMKRSQEGTTLSRPIRDRANW
jgi:hypothetical protein